MSNALSKCNHNLQVMWSALHVPMMKHKSLCVFAERNSGILIPFEDIASFALSLQLNKKTTAAWKSAAIWKK
jgi:hypothetical protein